MSKIDPKHEKAYTPSEWSKRLLSLELMTKFLELSQQTVTHVRSTVPNELDITYGPSERMKYDIYGTNLPGDAPVLIFIHGGYWQEFTKNLAAFHVPIPVSKGIKVINIGYNLCPEVTLSDIVVEIKQVIEKLLKICQKNGCNNVWIMGHSAGAHLAASILYDREWQTMMEQQQRTFQLIKGIILVGGIYSLQPLLTTSFNDALKLTEHEVKTLSFNNLDMNEVKAISGMKVIVTVGECDAPKFVEESQNYSKKLLEFIDRVEFILLRNNIDHFNIIENLLDSNFLLTKIIINNIKYQC
ncbi:hypothetical protein PV328_005925 [Microctonus aethiopoides]|uniref:BD-FAE-like domain-containing protein n=1 Tax=Microctonus aethiopoides TaxID=144406 RepID=A0AA39KST9_9HYME|nr:hypothetical protein PV328_005925 [Microctonus aethiopoides]